MFVRSQNQTLILIGTSKCLISWISPSSTRSVSTLFVHYLFDNPCLNLLFLFLLFLNFQPSPFLGHQIHVFFHVCSVISPHLFFFFTPFSNSSSFFRFLVLFPYLFLLFLHFHASSRPSRTFFSHDSTPLTFL